LKVTDETMTMPGLIRTTDKPDDYSAVRKWLITVALMVFAMVLLGGATRLTDSGLSITEWQPFMGAIPPLSEAEWQILFDKYKLIPEFKLQNSAMQLADFKSIYWWEWSHRFWGRLIGLVFVVPLVYFAATRRLSLSLFAKLVLLLVLGGLQGALGWFMVQSGLAVRTDVSQYRLVAHLALACLLYAAILWTIFGLGRKRAIFSSGHAAMALVLLVLVLGQIASGGFVAGLDAGMGFNTWPKMQGQWLPEGLLIMQPAWKNLFENAMTAQFDHRILAYVLVFFSAIHAYTSFRTSAMLLAYAIFAQALMGILTLLMHVPTGLALAHQALALIALTAAVWNLHRQALVQALSDDDEVDTFEP
jgi:heme a synthase